MSKFTSRLRQLALLVFILVAGGCTTAPLLDSHGPPPPNPKDQIKAWVETKFRDFKAESLWVDVPGKAYVDGGFFTFDPYFQGYAALFQVEIKTSKLDPFTKRVFIALFKDGQLWEVSRIAAMNSRLHFIDNRSDYRSPESINDPALGPPK